MSLPILQPSTIDTTQIRGDVTIDRSVIIASGVILNATSGTKIILSSGVCLGMGTIITAYDGDVEIKENTILGSGSLILGSCVIGSQVSLGASVTVYNTNVEPLTVIPAGTIIGDRSRRVKLKENEEISPVKEEKQENTAINNPTQTIIDGIKNGFATSLDDQIVENDAHVRDTDDRTIEENIPENKPDSAKIEDNAETEIMNQQEVSEENTTKVNTVVGQVYINKLLFTLFPERKTL
jgi:carbon dioxide concentrating mechanism protein CcmN